MKHKILIVLIGILLVVAFYVGVLKFGNNIDISLNNPTKIEVTEKPRLEDDYFTYINYDKLSINNLEEDDYYWYEIITPAEEAIENEKETIIKNILSNCDSYEENSNYKKICAFYDSYMNVDKSNVKSMIDEYITKINNVKNIKEYVNLVNDINYELSLDILYNVSANSELIGKSQNYFGLGYLSYDLDIIDSSYGYNYTDIVTSESNTFYNYIKKYEISMLEEYGYSKNEAVNMVNTTREMYQDIGRFSLKSDDYYLGKGFKLYNLSDIQKELVNIDLYKIFNNYSDIYDSSMQVMIADKNELLTVDKYLTASNLKTLKYYAIIKILNNYGKYIDDNYYKIEQELKDYYNYYYNDIVTNYASQKINKEELAYDYIYDMFNDTIIYAFKERNFSDAEKDFYTEIVKEEIEAFKSNIKELDWLSDATKEKAINKLNTMKYTIGISDELVYAENNYEFNNSFIDNLINAKKVNKNVTMKEFIKGNLTYRAIDQLDLNAFYYPSNNSINLLMGYAYGYKLYFGLNEDNLDENYYKILATIGYTLGHELTHSLDSSGSCYDENGNYSNWWTLEDKAAFQKLQADVVKYYNNYNMIGENTLGENIADLGGIKLVLTLANNKNATDDNYKTIFEEIAHDWSSEFTSYYQAYLLENDVHSSSKVRTNAVLSTIDKFYEVYNITENDKMYVSKENRVKVW